MPLKLAEGIALGELGAQSALNQAPGHVFPSAAPLHQAKTDIALCNLSVSSEYTTTRLDLLGVRLTDHPGTTPLTDTTEILGTNVNLAGAGQIHSP
jgi:hypothetical protein